MRNILSLLYPHCDYFEWLVVPTQTQNGGTECAWELWAFICDHWEMIAQWSECT